MSARSFRSETALRVHGLDKCLAGELLEFPGGVYGMSLNLEEDSVGAVLLGSDKEINEGDEVKRTGKVVEVPVGDAMIGRVVNALGQPIDGKGPIKTESFDRLRIMPPALSIVNLYINPFKPASRPSTP